MVSELIQVLFFGMAAMPFLCRDPFFTKISYHRNVSLTVYWPILYFSFCQKTNLHLYKRGKEKKRERDLGEKSESMYKNTILVSKIGSFIHCQTFILPLHVIIDVQYFLAFCLFCFSHEIYKKPARFPFSQSQRSEYLDTRRLCLGYVLEKSSKNEFWYKMLVINANEEIPFTINEQGPSSDSSEYTIPFLGYNAGSIERGCM